MYIVVATIRIELSGGKVFDKKKKNKKKEKTIHDFATRRFRTLATALAHDGCLDSFGIDDKWQLCLSKG